MKDESYVVPGFKASAVSAGLKKDGGLDMALIYCEVEATAAGVFTTNKVKAAPVLLTMKNIKAGTARAIIANSGNANACTGARGMSDAKDTALVLAKEMALNAEDVLVCSTGVIGLPLDLEKVSAAVPRLVAGLSERGLEQAARAIMTTDTFPKISYREGQVGGKPFKMAGIAKGAGMIMPNMATMLCFILTDVRIDRETLSNSLSWAVDRTFNRITVDGDTSTNDCVLAMASGMAGNGPLSESDGEAFRGVLREVAEELALMIVRDGEGATKTVKVLVKGAPDPDSALTAARTVANSLLVKTAFYGSDPNWGRIMAALGRSGIPMEENKVDIWIDDIQIVTKGLGPGGVQESKAAQVMKRDNFLLMIDLNMGPYQEQMWTCDISHEYVSINADYRT
ncbi:MAG TPA: bifunctional glutamate N-acetyltransferase/amino-acid acetyltransferase ArgJ [Desulfobacterales bacterium]|nr:bifunctional glutamate N-acetyltransferase/amino-acid acetyltransferase ArgJ [Desulfobacterales bacterium]